MRDWGIRCSSCGALTDDDSSRVHDRAKGRREWYCWFQRSCAAVSVSKTGHLQRWTSRRFDKSLEWSKKGHSRYSGSLNTSNCLVNICRSVREARTACRSRWWNPKTGGGITRVITGLITGTITGWITGMITGGITGASPETVSTASTPREIRYLLEISREIRYIREISWEIPYISEGSSWEIPRDITREKEIVKRERSLQEQQAGTLP